MALLFPGEQSWELWQANGDSNAELDLEARFDSADGVRFQRQRGSKGTSKARHAADRRIVALPVRSITSLPLWVNAPGEAEMQQAAELQLERAGLRANHEPRGVDFAVIEKRDSRSLILAQALAKNASPLDERSAPATDHLASPYLLPLPPNHLTLWRELGRLVAAITCRGKVVFFDALTAPQLDADAIREVHRMAAQLSLLDMLDRIEGIMLWTPEGDAQEIADGTGLPVDRKARPGPVMPARITGRLEPQASITAREKHRRRTRSRQLIKTIAMGIGAVALVAAAGLGALHWQRHSLRTELATLRPKAAVVESMQERWHSVAPAVDPDAFVLEALLKIHALPEAAAVTVETLDLSTGAIEVTGEATSATQALRFLDALASSEAFAEFDWSFPQPTLDGGPGSAARFEIRGSHYGKEGLQP